MYDFSNKTIREIALEAPLTTRVFESFKIDYCCGGRVPFTEACDNAGVDSSVLMNQLQQILDSKREDGTEFEERKSPGDLINHIVDTHHAFTRSEITRLIPLSEKVDSRHGDNHPELAEIKAVFSELASELLVHMRKEEAVLFPYISQLELFLDQKRMPPIPHFGTVNNPIRMMMFEHDAAGELLRKLRALSADYTAPDDACPSYKGLYAGLEDFEKDLHRHIHLENNVLFPKAIEMEESLAVAA